MVFLSSAYTPCAPGFWDCRTGSGSLALQIQQILFGDGLLAGQAAAGQDIRQLLGDDMS